MKLLEDIRKHTANALKAHYELDLPADSVQVQVTKPDIAGDYTVVLFPFLKAAKTNPVQLGKAIGEFLVEQMDAVTSYEVAGGFLNLSMSDAFWRTALAQLSTTGQVRYDYGTGKKVIVEFSSPNTNKPLHLGHIRNILLGWSTAQLLEKAGYEVIKTQVIHDRGIAICKSMLAWQLYGDGATPESTGKKGDHFVGDYYVLFEQKFQEEYRAWQQSPAGLEIFTQKKKEGQDAEAFFKGYKNTYFNEHSEMGRKAKEMLLAWEAGDADVMELWRTMNGWVYVGFDETYRDLGVHFDDTDHESETYLLGKEIVAKGLKEGVFYKEDDGSVWIDLEDVGLDKKIVLRSDGTAVYMTQDIGTIWQRYKKFGMDKMVYVVADEQDYHFKVLFEIAKKLGEPYADGLFHLSYGMVDLPTGKMKSREGTVVDADDLMQVVIEEARNSSEERGELSDLSDEGRDSVYRKVGLAALKYFILKVSPRKRMVFDPKESVDLQGQTGPYIQNAYVRIQSIFRKGAADVGPGAYQDYAPQGIEKELILDMLGYPEVIERAASEYDPSHLAHYVYDLAKKYHRFYHDFRVLTAETESAKSFRLELSRSVADLMRDAMELLGIEMPERM